MTDPRIAEIEARLEAHPGARLTTLATYDVRYLLDRVKELTAERDELLETAEYLRYRECSNCGW